MNARDPKHSPVDGDVIDDDGWTYTVTRFGLDEKKRSIVDYTVHWTFDGEPREEKRKKSLGAWRHLWRQADQRHEAAGRDTSVQDRSEPVEATDGSAGIVHRDVKPQNVLPEGQGRLFS